MNHYNLFNQLKKDCLVIDIETWAEFPNGQEINISYQFDQYLAFAKAKWFGAYSFSTNMLYILEVKKNKFLIQNLLNSHSILIGFNSEEFDYPIIRNNNLITDPRKRYLHVDCMQILGKSSFLNRSGFPFKNRGELMEYKFKNNSLRCMAETMKPKNSPWDKDWNRLLKDVVIECPNCLREIPNKEFKRKKGCPWCIQEDKRK